ncbi:MAG TPA: helix-turn-helix domain-containing protein [Coleofasciculaceae cyanobacterium]
MGKADKILLTALSPSKEAAIATTRLLAALPQDEYERLLLYMESVCVDLQQILYAPNEPIEHVYFLKNGVASLFPLTQEFLSQMLGVRRASVSIVAAIIQKAGLIRYSRGKMTILNREGLEECCCECYAIVKREFDRLLGGN